MKFQRAGRNADFEKSRLEGGRDVEDTAPALSGSDTRSFRGLKKCWVQRC